MEIASSVAEMKETTKHSVIGGEKRMPEVVSDEVCVSLCTLYTVNHKKRATLFSNITPAFLGRFLQFLYQ